MGEVWKSIPNFDGIYEISTYGRLKSFKKYKHGRILSQVNKKNDYFAVILSHKEKIRHTRIHRLVAEAFIPNPENKPIVNHIDGNKQNNSVVNMEWVTNQENVLHAIGMNENMIDKMKIYNKYIRPKTIQQFSKDGELLEEFNNSKEAHDKTGVCQRNILQVASKDEFSKGRVRKQAGGYVWKFKEVI